MNTKIKKHILFIAPTLGGGGAERILCNLLNHMDQAHFSCSVVLLKDAGVFRKDIPKHIPVYILDKKAKKKKSLFNVLQNVYSLAHLLPEIRPDAVVSFITDANILTILACKFSSQKPRVFISERNHYSIRQKKGRFKQLKRFLMRKLYPDADKIIAVSQGVKEDLCATFGFHEELITVIHNGIDLAAIQRLSVGKSLFMENLEQSTPVLVACGRLVEQKNYPLLLNAFKSVLEQTQAHLVIIGEGIKRESLVELSHTLQIQNNVSFAGFQKNPFPIITASSIFILSSDWEGFPNVLLEAMACGTSVIATRCPSGPEEIVTNNVDGLLVPCGDVAALSHAILQILQNAPLRSQLALNAAKRVKDFQTDKMVIKYEELINNEK